MKRIGGTASEKGRNVFIILQVSSEYKLRYSFLALLILRERQTDRQRETEREKEKDRERQRERQRETDRERQRVRQRDGERQTERDR